MTLKAVLFDHDGTLVDSEDIHFRLWKEVAKRYDIALTITEYEAHYSGIPTLINASTLISSYKLQIASTELAEQKEQATRDYLSKAPFPLMPAARESIEFFYKAGAKLAVVSAAVRNVVDATVNAYGFAHCFETIVSGDDVKRGKPAPDCYLLALERLGVSASETIVIEDTEHGIRAAAAAGISCCGVRNAMSREHDFSLAIRAFDSLADTTRWIAENYTMSANARAELR